MAKISWSSVNLERIMNIEMDQTTLATAASVFVSLAAGFFLRGAKTKNGRLEDSTEWQQARSAMEEELESREKSLAERLLAVEEKERKIVEKESELKSLESKLESQHADLVKLEDELKEMKSALVDREKQLSEMEKELKEKEMVAPDLMEVATTDTADTESRRVESEKEKRLRLISEELKTIIKQAEDEELEDEMEEDAIKALEKAALIICHRKKYYDVMKDELIYFPSVSRTILNYDLIEEAEKYYFEDEDEFPMEYSAAMRSVVSTNLGDDDDMDEDYMAKLALDVEI